MRIFAFHRVYYFHGVKICRCSSAFCSVIRKLYKNSIISSVALLLEQLPNFIGHHAYIGFWYFLNYFFAFGKFQRPAVLTAHIKMQLKVLVLAEIHYRICVFAASVNSRIGFFKPFVRLLVFLLRFTEKLVCLVVFGFGFFQFGAYLLLFIFNIFLQVVRFQIAEDYKEEQDDHYNVKQRSEVEDYLSFLHFLLLSFLV